MTDLAKQEKLAIGHIHSLGGEALPQECYSADLTAWSPISGMMKGSDYLEKLKSVRTAFSDPLKMSIDVCTTQPGRTAIQCRSVGTLRNGSAYANSYHMLVEFNEEGRIRHVREYMDTKRAEEVLMPFLREWIANERKSRS